MRFTDADLLTHDEAAILLKEMEQWCRRTGTSYNRLVTAARVPPNTRASIRQRKRRITIKLAAKLRTAMNQNRKGIDKEQHLRNRLAPSDIPPKPPLIVVDRSPCHRCGVRKDIGCGKCPVSVSMLNW